MNLSNNVCAHTHVFVINFVVRIIIASELNKLVSFQTLVTVTPV